MWRPWHAGQDGDAAVDIHLPQEQVPGAYTYAELGHGGTLEGRLVFLPSGPSYEHTQQDWILDTIDRTGRAVAALEFSRDGGAFSTQLAGPPGPCEDYVRFRIRRLFNGVQNDPREPGDHFLIRARRPRSGEPATICQVAVRAAGAIIAGATAGGHYASSGDDDRRTIARPTPGASTQPGRQPEGTYAKPRPIEAPPSETEPTFSGQPIFLGSVIPPGPEGVGGRKLSDSVLAEGGRKTKQWYRQWLPYAVDAYEFEQDFFDMKDAKPSLGTKWDYKHPTDPKKCYRCQWFNDVRRITLRAHVLRTHWCQVRAFPTKENATWNDVKDLYYKVLPVVRLAKSSVDLLRSALSADVWGIGESIWGMMGDLEEVAEGSPNPHKLTQDEIENLRRTYFPKRPTSLDYPFDYVFPPKDTSKTRTSVDFTVDFTNWTTGKYHRCYLRNRLNEETGEVEYIPCPDGLDFKQPQVIGGWEQDMGQLREWQRSGPGHTITSQHIPVLLDTDLGINQGSKIPEPHLIENWANIEPGLLPFDNAPPSGETANYWWQLSRHEQVGTIWTWEETPCFDVNGRYGYRPPDYMFDSKWKKVSGLEEAKMFNDYDLIELKALAE